MKYLIRREDGRAVLEYLLAILLSVCVAIVLLYFLGIIDLPFLK